jgi:hypothetical protein
MPTLQSAVLERQVAIQTRLLGDTTLMGMITGVFDEAPEGQAAPYITYGQHTDAPFETFGKVNSEALMLLDIWSTRDSDDECYQILAEVRRLVETRPTTAPLVLPSYGEIIMRYEWSTLIREQDSNFRHMVVRFHSYASEA